MQNCDGDMPSYTEATVEGKAVNLEANCPQDIMAQLEEAQQRQALDAWAQEPGRETLLPRPWLLPAKHLMARKLSRQWAKGHRSIVHMAATGAFPEQVALYEDGRADSPKCPLCGEEDGTLQHFYWRCQHKACVQARKQLAPLTKQEKKPNFANLVHRGATAEEEPWKWARRLLADPLAGYAWGSPMNTSTLEDQQRRSMGWQ